MNIVYGIVGAFVLLLAGFFGGTQYQAKQTAEAASKRLLSESDKTLKAENEHRKSEVTRESIKVVVQKIPSGDCPQGFLDTPLPLHATSGLRNASASVKR